MSRQIPEKKSYKLTKEQNELTTSSNNKLVFTEYQNHKCALLIQSNRLIYAQVFDNSMVGSVYIAKVKNVAKNINACFVEIANREICFLPLTNINSPILLNRYYDGRILQGDEILVQVTKDAQKNKQATVSSNISCSNEYFVISLEGNGVSYSLKLKDADKQRLQSVLEELNIISDSYSLMIRTKANLLTKTKLFDAYNQINTQFQSIVKTAKHSTCFHCIHKETSMDYLSILAQFVPKNSFDEIITDDEEVYSSLLASSCDDFHAIPIRYYQDKSFPLHLIYGIKSKMETALEERIWLKSGAFIVIQSTEAMTVIDVNSGKFEPSGRTSEECALIVNEEASKEIALQLRLRNLSGIIMIDFINMKEKDNNHLLLNNLRDYVKSDPVKTIVVDMTKLGIVEITRKKVLKPLKEQLFGAERRESYEINQFKKSEGW